MQPATGPQVPYPAAWLGPTVPRRPGKCLGASGQLLNIKKFGKLDLRNERKL